MNSWRGELFARRGATVLQSTSSSNSFISRESPVGTTSNLDFGYLFGIFKRRFFYFLLPFGLLSTLGLYVAALQSPSYLSEGKILLEVDTIAPDIVRPVVTSTTSESVQLIEQRVTSRDTLLSIANKFNLYPQIPQRALVLDLMRKSVVIKPVQVESRSGRGTTATVAINVGFEYDNPEIAMRVASELVGMIVGENARSRTSRAKEGVRILSDEAKDIESKLDSAQNQILELARRPRDTIPETPEQQRLDLAALTALKNELAQKSSVYSEAHPAVVALKKRVAAMEKAMTQTPQPKPGATSSQSTQDEIDILKKQRDALQTRLAETNSKLASARISETQEQRSESLQVIESPSMPLKPKSDRKKVAGISFVAALLVAAGSAIGFERLDGSIRRRREVEGLLPASLIVSIPYISTRADDVRTRWRVVAAILVIAIILAAWGALATAVVLKWPLTPPLAELWYQRH
jgi:uncharacterized protein involved in exopolysaccharide biosynthesis